MRVWGSIPLDHGGKQGRSRLGWFNSTPAHHWQMPGSRVKESDMYPEVENYLTVCEQAGETRSEVMERASNELGESRGTNRRGVYDARCLLARHDHDVAVKAAWNDMKASSDPLVAWIAENCQEYYSYAIQILKVLPADLAAINQVASDKDWCDTWEQFLERATEAGVVPSAPALSASRQELVRWFKYNFSGTRSAVAELLQRVDAVVAAERTATPAEGASDVDVDVDAPVAD